MGEQGKHERHSEEPAFRFIHGREVRTVPAGWDHPRDDRGRPIPLLRSQMPSARNETAIMAYEATTEGTPISPAFSDTPAGRLDLVRYCAEHCTTFGSQRAGVEGWAAILFGDHAVITQDGTIEIP